jgi:hypothetical protein
VGLVCSFLFVAVETKAQMVKKSAQSPTGSAVWKDQVRATHCPALDENPGVAACMA